MTISSDGDEPNQLRSSTETIAEPVRNFVCEAYHVDL